MCNSKTLGRYLEVKELIKALKAEEKELNTKIANSVKVGEEVINGNFKIKLANITTNKFDSKAFKVEYPEIHSEFCKESYSERLTVKALPVLN